MQYTTTFSSPLGEILLAADEAGLTGLWFQGQKYFAQGLDPEHREGSLPALDRAREWLTVYFSGREPGFTPPLHLTGTEFQNRVWRLLLAIPYGTTATYGQIAQRLAAVPDAFPSSPRAVGGAVGRNRISLIVPCHRVVGSHGSLTGYAGGVEKKAALLQLESSHERAAPAP